MLLKSCIQYVSKFGKLNSGHRTGKCQFSFQSQRKGNAKECSNYHKIALISLPSKCLGVLSCFSRIWLFATLWTIACQAALPGYPWIGFSRQEYWSGFPFPSPGGLPHSRTEPSSFISPTLAGGFFTTSTWEASKVMLKIFQSRIHRYVNWELPDVQGTLEKGRGTRSRRQWHPTPVLLPGKSHGWRSLVGCSPWNR